MRLSEVVKEDFEELLKEFEKGQINRDEAIYLLGDRRREPEGYP